MRNYPIPVMMGLSLFATACNGKGDDTSGDGGASLAVGEAERLMEWGDLGAWDRATNSCIHATCNIANAGGAGLPGNPTDQTAYIYRNLIQGN